MGQTTDHNHSIVRSAILFDAFQGVVEGVVREHSREPDALYNAVIARTAGLSRCDLFALQSREGFDT